MGRSKSLLLKQTAECGLDAAERVGRCENGNEPFRSIKIRFYYQLGIRKVLKHDYIEMRFSACV